MVFLIFFGKIQVRNQITMKVRLSYIITRVYNFHISILQVQRVQIQTLQTILEEAMSWRQYICTFKIYYHHVHNYSLTRNFNTKRKTWWPVTLLERCRITPMLINFHRYHKTLNYGFWQLRTVFNESDWIFLCTNNHWTVIINVNKRK